MIPRLKLAIAKEIEPALKEKDKPTIFALIGEREVVSKSKETNFCFFNFINKIW